MDITSGLRRTSSRLLCLMILPARPFSEPVLTAIPLRPLTTSPRILLCLWMIGWWLLLRIDTIRNVVDCLIAWWRWVYLELPWLASNVALRLFYWCVVRKNLITWHMCSTRDFSIWTPFHLQYNPRSSCRYVSTLRVEQMCHCVKFFLTTGSFVHDLTRFHSKAGSNSFSEHGENANANPYPTRQNE